MLKVEVAPAAMPSEKGAAARVAAAVEPPRFASIWLPDGGADVERRRERVAAEAVASAVVGRGLPKPR
ncbi:hypothetical protein, partial [Actinomadura darangshiensis]|uniref:hypothetical protein n=1 Tax=Actinomadura darangshiensis TaxID=705336 RepID=UPI001A9E5817